MEESESRKSGCIAALSQLKEWTDGGDGVGVGKEKFVQNSDTAWPTVKWCLRLLRDTECQTTRQAAGSGSEQDRTGQDRLRLDSARREAADEEQRHDDDRALWHCGAVRCVCGTAQYGAV